MHRQEVALISVPNGLEPAACLHFSLAASHTSFMPSAVYSITPWLTTHFTNPREMEGWVGLVGWLIVDALPGEQSHVMPAVWRESGRAHQPSQWPHHQPPLLHNGSLYFLAETVAEPFGWDQTLIWAVNFGLSPNPRLAQRNCYKK